MQEQLTDELQRARDDPKISAKSAQLAFNKFQRDVHRCAHALTSVHEAHRRTTPPPPIERPLLPHRIYTSSARRSAAAERALGRVVELGQPPPSSRSRRIW